MSEELIRQMEAKINALRIERGILQSSLAFIMKYIELTAGEDMDKFATVYTLADNAIKGMTHE